MTGCAHEDDWLLGLLDGELPPGRLAEVEAHLAVCEYCRRAVEDYRAIIDSYREGMPEEPPDESTARLVRSAAAMTVRRRGPSPALAAAAVLLLAAGAVGGWLLRGALRDDTPPAGGSLTAVPGGAVSEVEEMRKTLGAMRLELERARADQEVARAGLRASVAAGAADAGVEAVRSAKAGAAKAAEDGITGGEERVDGAGGGSGGLAAPRWQAKKRMADDPLAGDLSL
jgi:hypothetical protein